MQTSIYVWYAIKPHPFVHTHQLNSPELESSCDVESLVGVWTRESPHNYENNSDKVEDFVCSSATR